MRITRLPIKIFLTLLFSTIASVFHWFDNGVWNTDYYSIFLLFLINLMLFFGLAIINTELKVGIKQENPDNKNMVLVLLFSIPLSFFFSWLLYLIMSLLTMRAPNEEQRPFGIILMAFFYCIFLLTDTYFGALSKLYSAYHKKHVDKEFKNTKTKQTKKWPELLVKTKKDLIKLKVNNIALIKTKGGIVIIYDMEGNGHVSQYSSINEVGEIHNIPFLFRVNRQYVLNFKIVRAYKDGLNGKLCVELQEDFNELAPSLEISRYKNKDFKTWYNLMTSNTKAN